MDRRRARERSGGVCVFDRAFTSAGPLSGTPDVDHSDYLNGLELLGRVFSEHPRRTNLPTAGAVADPRSA